MATKSKAAEFLEANGWHMTSRKKQGCMWIVRWSKPGHIGGCSQGQAVQYERANQKWIEQNKAAAGVPWKVDFDSACRKNFKRLTVEELLAVGAWSDFLVRGGSDPRKDVSDAK